MAVQLPPVKAAKRLGGMADILATASRLGLEPEVRAANASYISCKGGCRQQISTYAAKDSSLCL